MCNRLVQGTAMLPGQLSDWFLLGKFSFRSSASTGVMTHLQFFVVDKDLVQREVVMKNTKMVCFL